MKTDYYYHSPYKEDKIQITNSTIVHTSKDIKETVKSKIEKHIRHSRITIYGQYDEKTEIMKFSKSICWGMDKFSRFFGRENAEANLKQNKVILVTPVPTEQLGTPGKWFIQRAKELEEIHLKGS